MQPGAAGFWGGVIGGLIKLILDQTAFASNISSVDTVGMFSQLLGMQYFAMWIIYILATGVIGWIISQFVIREYSASYFSSGVLLGVTLWGIMNIFFSVTGVTTPTWAMGIGSLIVNLISHIVLGIGITYALWRFGTKGIQQS